MEQAQPRIISIKKYDDEIIVAPKEGLSADEHIEQLVSIHGAGGVFVDGKSVAQIRKEAEEAAAAENDVALIGSSVQPAVLKIGDDEVQLGDIVAAAQAESGLTAKQWNKLSDKKREAAIAAEIERRVEALKTGGAQ